MCKRDLTIAAT